MADQCGAPEVYDSSDEYSREERVETIYQGWGAREMAERIVELEDELGADVDGICTGMHADVAEAHTEIERLSNQVANFRGWRASIYEVARSSIRSAGKARKSTDRYRLAWLSARRRAADEANMGLEALDRERARQASFVAELQPTLRARMGELRRHRAFADEVRQILGWTHVDGNWREQHMPALYDARHELDSAQREGRAFVPNIERRAARGEFDYIEEEADDLRKSTSGARLEQMGADEDGDVWRLAGS
ncbi:hypothetical protein [Streptomyces sp. NPDC002952]|uniref:hypothetical protein n=1 Tax=Streptomyces sp. NPDC002952 TaxID=3364673 RepID=UPI0036C22602